MRGWDRRALEGLPLKLLIMSLLISLTAPAVLGSMDAFERTAARSQLEVEASRLWNVVEEIISAGEGNRRTVITSLPASIDRYGLVLEVGGDLDAVASLGIRCCCGGAILSNLILNDPPARVTSEAGSTLTLGGGEHSLLMECQRVSGRTSVVASVIE